VLEVGSGPSSPNFPQLNLLDPQVGLVRGLRGASEILINNVIDVVRNVKVIKFFNATINNTLFLV
jgi:hypothetical protein